MAHHHLALDLLGRFQSPAHHDHDGGAAQGQAVEAAELAEKAREQRDNAQEQRAHQADLVDDALDIIRGGDVYKRQACASFAPQRKRRPCAAGPPRKS